MEIAGSTERDNAFIRDQLRAYNAAYLRDFRDYSCHIREDGRIVAGAVAESTLDAVEVEFLFVDSAWRGKGLGEALLRHIEGAAARDGMRRVLLNTYSFQAPEFYRKMGYRELFVLDPCFDGVRQHYFAKEL